MRSMNTYILTFHILCLVYNFSRKEKYSEIWTSMKWNIKIISTFDCDINLCSSTTEAHFYKIEGYYLQDIK